MTLHVALAVSALVASAALFLSGQSRALSAVALAASGLEVAMAFGLLRLAVAGLPLALVLGLALAIPGLLAWLRATAKTAISAAAVVSFAGVLQVFVALNRHPPL
jgi:uncharacterized protein YybS (DUF2232 family)